MATERQRLPVRCVSLLLCLARLHAKFATKLASQSFRVLLSKTVRPVELAFALAWHSPHCLLSRFSSGRASLPRARQIRFRQILVPLSLRSILAFSFSASDW